MDFSKILADVMLENGFNQTTLAKKMNIKPSQVSEWLSGKSKPGYDNLILLSKACKVSSDRLLGIE